MRLFKNTSFSTLLIIIAILSVYRISNVNNKEISWDVLGYYLPLPATFIHNDPMLNNIDWLKAVNKEKKLTGTLYMVSSNDEGEPMYFFLLGMAIFYLPFFFMGHFSSFLLGMPTDGFSPPYQYALVIGSIIYTIIGLYYLRKILLSFFSEKISSIILITTVFATNYIHHLTLKDLETVNILFMLVSIIVWFTIKWHKEQKIKHLIIIVASITLIALVKPSEIVVLLIPLFWNVTSKETLRSKIDLISKYRTQFFIAIGISIIIASPQIIYWILKTGMPLYDSYKNPGIGLDIFSPHILDGLFSYRKGWLVYTPIMFFYLFGFIPMFKENKKIFFAIIIYFLVSFYIISSWSEWWYGAGFSNRPLITTYPLLSISLGYFILYIQKKSTLVKTSIVILILFFTFLNQFQWWQLKNYILDTSRTTKEYYWATFLKTSVTPEQKKLLLIERDFSGKMSFVNKKDYHSSIIETNDFEDANDPNILTDSLNNKYYQFLADQEFGLTKKFTYNDLTTKDHLWVIVSFDLKYPSEFDASWPCLVVSMDRKGGSYGYFAPEIKPDSINDGWANYKFEYLTPEIRNRNDILKIYIWKRGKKSFDVDNFMVKIFEKN